MKVYFAIGVLPLALAACTTKLVSREDNGSVGNPGIPYHLPFLQYTITAKYTLIQCPSAGDHRSAVKIAVDAKPGIIEDPVERLIDYEQLTSGSKTSDFSVEYYDGTALLKSVNASVVDKSPEIAANVLKAVVSIAGIVYGLPPAAGAAGAAVQKRGCLLGVEAMVSASNKARKAIDDFPERSQEVSDRLAVYTTMAQLGAMTPTDKKNAAKDIKESQDLAKSLDALKKQVVEYDKRVTYETEWTFPDVESRDTRPLYPPKSIHTWLDLLLEPVDSKATGDELDASLYALLIPSRPAKTCTPSKTDTCEPKNDGTDGIAYRTPSPGTLKVCRQPSASACASDVHPLFKEKSNVPQFGTMHFLQLHNGWGQDNELNVTFARTGELTTFKYASKSSPVEKGTAVAASVAEQAASIVEQRRAKSSSDKAYSAAKASDDEKVETESIQHQIDVLNLKTELATLQANLADPNAAEKNTEISTLTADIARLQLEKQRKDLLDALGNQP